MKSTWRIQDLFKLKVLTNYLNVCLCEDTSAEEVVAQCVAAGHYTTALFLCSLCNLSYTGPLQALTVACVHIQDNERAWKWLFLNDITGKMISSLLIGKNVGVLLRA